MAIEGVSIVQHGNKTVCTIENLSDELKDKIRKELAAIVHGTQEASALPEYHSYKRTLLVFLDRYDSKSEEIKMGMIGELLAHILMPSFFDNLTSLSVLKNKEERSIKKGFDIVYCDLSEESFWYSEVKSGEKNEDHDVPKANRILLNRANTSLKEMFSGDVRDSLWDSAIIDVGLNIDAIKAPTIKKLLSEDSPLMGTFISTDKNAIFISVLYEPEQNPLDHTDLDKFVTKVKTEAFFNSILACSFQKGTYQKVAEFLQTESVS